MDPIHPHPLTTRSDAFKQMVIDHPVVIEFQPRQARRGQLPTSTSFTSFARVLPYYPVPLVLCAFSGDALGVFAQTDSTTTAEREEIAAQIEAVSPSTVTCEATLAGRLSLAGAAGAAPQIRHAGAMDVATVDTTWPYGTAVVAGWLAGSVGSAALLAVVGIAWAWAWSDRLYLMDDYRAGWRTAEQAASCSDAARQRYPDALWDGVRAVGPSGSSARAFLTGCSDFVDGSGFAPWHVARSD